ncbi:MAG TPA: MBL fold metallo-hydrolase [Steroidobacteraceae bacterium]|nr:MBL fold metallo-hydrolase [Steroidobacteraceae bacterium]
MQLEFYGAAGEVTGSCHILTVGGRTVLLDCGMIQGGEAPDRRNHAEFPFDAARIAAVILSHAHIDHCGRLPLLRKRGFRGPIYATSACRDLARILLADSAHMAQRDAERENRRRAADAEPHRIEPLYTIEDAAQTIDQFRLVPYGRAVPVVPGVTLTFRDAGHILGSASVWLDLREGADSRRLVFSGDLGQYDSPIVRDPEGDGGTDVLVMESTYGDRLHRERADTLRQFGEILRQADRDRGNVLIPAFAVGRTQDVIYQFGMFFEEWGLERWRIFLDSPMAIEASRVYWQHTELYDEEARELRLRVGNLAPLPNLTLCRTAEESKQINGLSSGAIIIAGSGMCTGGRIVHHLKHNLARPECHVVFTGFQAVGTLGRAIVDGRKAVRVQGTHVPVAAKVHTLGGFSAHGDQQDLLRWYRGVGGRPRVWLVHGEPTGAEGLREALHREGASVGIARPGQSLDLAAMP